MVAWRRGRSIGLYGPGKPEAQEHLPFLEVAISEQPKAETEGTKFVRPRDDSHQDLFLDSISLVCSRAKFPPQVKLLGSHLVLVVLNPLALYFYCNMI